jgi:hypothetical protein
VSSPSGPLLAIQFVEPGQSEKSGATHRAGSLGIAGRNEAAQHGRCVYSHQADSLHLPGDMHSTVLGHKVVADRLYESLRATDTALQRHPQVNRAH